MGGYSAQKKEFDKCLRKITQLGYGIVIIAHVDKRNEKRADDTEVEILGPSIPKRCYDIVNQLVDIIGYIDITWDEKGESVRKLYTRKTPTVMAGSRFKYLKPVIDFGYDELVEAISEAIEKEEQNGAKVIDTKVVEEEKEISFEEVREKASKLWQKLVSSKEIPAEQEAAAIRIMGKVEEIFGHPIKLGDITEKQLDLFTLVVYEMEQLDN